VKQPKKDNPPKSLLARYARAAGAAFPHTVPVLTGYVFLGTVFGVLLQSAGYGTLFALLMSAAVYAGSMQFVAVSLLSGPFLPVQAALLTLMVNARHLFYGLSMLERFAGLGRAKPYLVFSLTDETFSLLCAVTPPEGVDPKAFDLCLSAMNQGYWVAGSVFGSLLGAAIPFDARGIEFVMTALFVVIFLEQWRTKKGRAPAVLGVLSAVACLLLFGATWFILLTMAVLVLLLAALQTRFREEAQA